MKVYRVINEGTHYLECGVLVLHSGVIVVLTEDVAAAVADDVEPIPTAIH